MDHLFSRDVFDLMAATQLLQFASSSFMSELHSACDMHHSDHCNATHMPWGCNASICSMQSFTQALLHCIQSASAQTATGVL